MDADIIIKHFDQASQEPYKGEINNILILALSTISQRDGVINLNRYTCDVELKIYKKESLPEPYHYQLEPVPMMLTSYLKSNSKHIDEIIMLCTPEVKAKTAKSDGKGGKIIYETLKLNGGKISDKSVEPKTLSANPNDRPGISALDYFVDFIQRMCKENGLPIPLFVEIDLADNKDKSLENAIGNIIREIRRREGAELYIDTHGGLRTSQEVINSVLSLLRSEGVIIPYENIFSVVYDNGSSKITPAGLTFDIMDFVSGMTELMNYGRTDSLNKFFNKYHLSQSGKDLIEIVGKIAAGMQLCNIAEFENNLKNLASLLPKIDAKDSSGHQTEILDIFVDNIRNNYAGLLTANRSVIDEIKWCLDKGFYQQVLTLIESKIPQYIHDKGIFTYDQEIRNIGELYKDKYELDNFLFNNTTGDLINKKNRFDIFDSCKQPVAINTMKKPSINKFKTVLTIGNKTKDFLRHHYGLKELRNLASHASKEQNILSNRNDFEAEINNYLNLLNSLEQTANLPDCKIQTSPKQSPSVRCTVDISQCPQGLQSSITNMESVGPDSLSPGDTDDTALEKAVRTAVKILFYRPRDVVCYIPDDQYKQYLIAILQIKGINVMTSCFGCNVTPQTASVAYQYGEIDSLTNSGGTLNYQNNRLTFHSYDCSSFNSLMKGDSVLFRLRSAYTAINVIKLPDLYKLL